MKVTSKLIFSIVFLTLGINAIADFYTGDQYFKNGKYEEARQEFLRSRSDYRSLLGAATTSRLLGKYEEAADLYSEFIRIKPEIAEGYFGRALSYRGMEEYSLAEEDFKMAIAQEKNQFYYAGLGDLYLLTGKMREARSILEEGNSLFPDSSLIKKLLARSYNR